jgi:hypothetical protein
MLPLLLLLGRPWLIAPSRFSAMTYVAAMVGVKVRPLRVGALVMPDNPNVV